MGTCLTHPKVEAFVTLGMGLRWGSEAKYLTLYITPHTCSLEA